MKSMYADLEDYLESIDTQSHRSMVIHQIIVGIAAAKDLFKDSDKKIEEVTPNDVIEAAFALLPNIDFLSINLDETASLH